MASSNILLLHLNGKPLAGLESDIHSAEIATYLYSVVVEPVTVVH
jgi:hypothetical protein